ncbi:uncharacterized protein LOC131220118 [Magnolia sinica]|uniref:uncharacterized protein LOC131220118 n=1 Tax=Magnolia sinica TaxID=86752 RepID=UPI002658EB1E|nr:uncharacterized protein LOC131220118 [Magnolia sinica]
MPGTSSVENRLAQWWFSPTFRSSVRYVQNLVPCLILWETWKASNSAVFYGRSPSPSSLISRICWWISFIGRNSRTSNQLSSVSTSVPNPQVADVSFSFNVNNTRSPSSYLVVNWRRPPCGWVKINIDGSARGNPGMSGGGGVCRNEKDVLLFTFSEEYGLGSNIRAELRAIHNGLYHCISRGHWSIIVEFDSQLVIDFLLGVATPCWKWSYWLSRIENLKLSGQVQFAHIFREDNGPADAMARLGSSNQSSTVVDRLADLLSHVWGSLFLDRVGLGSIREL